MAIIAVATNDNSPAPAPQHAIEDWDYFLNYSDSKTHVIPYYFDNKAWQIGNIYRVRVSNVYNPSKFWVVEPEMELDAFHKYMHFFYSKYKKHYKVPKQNFKLYMYCSAFTEGAYYRSIMISTPHSINSKLWVFVYLIDFGFIAKVDIDDIYFLTKKMYSPPQFAIRATLVALGPIENTWTPNCIQQFSTLVDAKVVLAQVRSKDDASKVLYLSLGIYDQQNKCVEDLGSLLVKGGLMRALTINEIKEIKCSQKKKKWKKNKHKVKIPFLYPTFNMIENGFIPDNVMASSFLDKIYPK